MTETIQLFLAVGVMIGFAKVMGYFAYHLNQPAVLGELVAGVLIGPSVVNLLGSPSIFPDGVIIQHTIVGMGEIGVLMLMFMAGLDVDVPRLLKVGLPAVLAGILGVAGPLLLIVPVVILFGHMPEKALFIGIVFASTSTSISTQVMLELRVLRTRVGLNMLGAALVDDAVVILLLSIFVAINPGGVVTVDESRSVSDVLSRMSIFLVIGFLVSWFLLPHFANRINHLSISQGTVMFAIVATLLMSFAAEYIGGIAAITGAFMAGAGFRRARNNVREMVERGVHTINYALFAPLFFISIGLQANLRLLTAEMLPFALIVTGLAIVSKVIGAAGGSRLGGFDWIDSLRVGTGMISRGEVGLITAAIGMNMGILQLEIFTVVVFVVLVTTLITPLLVRWSFGQNLDEIRLEETAVTPT